MNDMVNYKIIIERIKERKSFRHDKEVADLFGLSINDFSNRKRRGSLLPCIVSCAINDRIDLNWLLTGEEQPQTAKCPICGNWSNETRNACIDMQNILNTGDETARMAILSTIKALEEAAVKTGAKKRKKDTNPLDE